MPMKLWRDGAAVVIALLAFGLGLLPLTIFHYDPGIRLGVDEAANRLIVTSVDPWGPAAQDGVESGSIVLRMNDTTLLELPHQIYSDPTGPTAPDNPDADLGPVLIGTEPAVPTSHAENARLALFASTSIDNLELIRPSDLATGNAASGWPTVGVYYPGWYRLYDAGTAILPALGILLIGSWWLVTGRAGPSLQGIGFPLAAAVATPLFVLTLFASGSPLQIVLAGLLCVAAMVPLALALAGRVEASVDRRFAVVSIAVCSIAASVFAVAFVVDPLRRGVVGDLRWVATAAIPLIPGLIAAGPLTFSGASGRRGPGKLMRSTELALAGATPAFALVSDRSPFIWPLVIWLVAIWIAGRFTVRPLARLATRATLQRDLVVAATEAERARLAADIHDDALQELTLLVRRLEASGDEEGAEIGRTVADRLRAICGDLRLPILDDLGVGPALDWLVLRIERLAGGEVRLERADDARHNPDVELAIFRVAQEALANAVKHGRPPIVVRYRSTPAGISLAVDDAGPGISDDAPDAAEKTGRFGLLNMAQRAEQIGAILDVKRWPGGGTHVALEWRPR
jgi:signal transduction histidine kinase